MTISWLLSFTNLQDLQVCLKSPKNDKDADLDYLALGVSIRGWSNNIEDIKK